MKAFPILTLIAAAALVAISPLHADFWPEFRGADGDGHAEDADVPTSWSSTRNIRWEVDVPGKAWSSPVVADGKIFISTAVEEGDQLLLETRCHELSDGSEVWTKQVFKKEAIRIHKKNSHASPTPLYGNGVVHVHFGHHGTAALDAGSGEILWQQTDLEYSPVHGNGGSPAIFEDKLIFSCDGAQNPFVVALDKKNGSVVWKTPRDVEVSRTFSFSTPLIIEVGGKPQAVVPGSGAVISYDPNSGKEIWRFDYDEGYSVVPRPIYHNGKIYVCSGFGRAVLFAIRVDGTGDVTDTHLAWKNDKAIPKESSPIIVDGLLYINDDKGILSCFDAETGEEIYRERMDGEGGYSSSPVYAGGHLYFHNGEGVTTVVKPGREFDKVEENDIREYGLSSFAVVSDGFVVRTEEHLIRIGE